MDSTSPIRPLGDPSSPSPAVPSACSGPVCPSPVAAARAALNALISDPAWDSEGGEALRLRVEPLRRSAEAASPAPRPRRPKPALPTAAEADASPTSIQMKSNSKRAGSLQG